MIEQDDLAEDALAILLARDAGPVVAAFSTSWCGPCRLMAPLLPRLARALSFTLVRIDGDAAPGAVRRHAIEGFPTLVLFRTGAEVGRVVGFPGYDGLRLALANLVPVEPWDVPTEAAYRAAVGTARATFDATVAAARAGADARIEAVAPELDALQTALNDEVAAGRLAAEEVRGRMATRMSELFAPFRAELDAADAAEDEAMKLYARTVSEVETRFVGEVGPASVVCRLGDTSCSV